MGTIIFRTSFYCELCKHEIPVPVYGSPDTILTTKNEPEVIEWARHYHWIDHHRVCALCGSLVKPDTLELLHYDDNIKIHGNYTDEYKKIEENRHFRQLLIVHEACAKKGQD